jgi:DNA repair protein RAD16
VPLLQLRSHLVPPPQYTENFKVLVWHGSDRETDAAEVQKYDVVLATYAVLESSFRKEHQGFKRKGVTIKEPSAVHAIHWHRIVLDEAHNIKERSTNTAKAAFELKGTFRWCLSGTPLQNRVGDLYSQIKFLGGDPFSFYLCKKCPCKSAYWSFENNRYCRTCGHTAMSHGNFWNQEVLKPIQRGGASHGEGGDAFKRMRLLLSRIMLRRTKIERADDMGLPPRTIVVRQDKFSEEEEDLYTSLYQEGTRKFNTYLDQGTVLNNYSNIFTLLTRMRQMACHPDLVLRSKTGMAAKMLGEAAGEGVHVCRLCTDEAEDAIMSKVRSGLALLPSRHTLR